MKFYYYQIVNKINNKKYIGITEHLEQRFKTHKKLLNNGTHVNYKLQEDWNLYGEENFLFELIQIKECDLEEGYETEYQIIQNSKNLYNLAPGGLINPMYSEEIRKKMRKSKQSQVPNIYQLEEIEENVFKVINEFNSQKEAQKSTGCSQANICKSLKKNIKGSGYYWINEDQLETFSTTWRPTRTKMSPTAQLDKSGQIEKVHYNRSLFEQEYGWKSTTITSAIRRNGKAFGIKFVPITEEEYYSLKPITLIF